MVDIKKLWIDGTEQAASSGATMSTPNPATGEVLAELQRANAEDVDRAVRSARAAFEGPWGKMAGRDRAKILWRVGELIEKELEPLAELESLDSGKPIANSKRADIPLSADTFHYFAGWATKIHGDVIPVRTPTLCYTLREPVGVVAAITPWNFPLLLAARKVAAALAAGNTVILKPPEEASLTCVELGRILMEAGAPKGVLNVVTGLGEEAGEALVKHAGVDKIAFTGSTEVGKRIQRTAADTLKKLALELGGKCPNIILEDADLGAAIPGAVRAAYYNQGQVCTAGSRLLVHKSIHDRVVEGVVEGSNKLVVGDPMDAKTELGPLVSETQQNRVLGYIGKGSEEGAKRLSGTDRSGAGYYVEPTVFDGVSPEMVIAKEEIFGPVVSVISFDDLEEAAQIADSTEYGLAAGVWTRDVGKAHSLAARLRAGTVWVNCYNLYDSASPYGGMKHSGYGRENGAEAMREMTQTKSVWVALS